MKIKPLVLLCLLCCLTPVAYAQTKGADSKPPTQTYGMVNGRMWVLMGEQDKQIYLIGFTEGLAQGSGDRATFIPKGFTRPEIAEALDQFYGETNNVLISVTFALPIITLKATGTPQPAIDKILALSRQHALEAPEHAGQKNAPN